jgi:medium-chain acyl-[acyl-carrier-protein] hydrolase
MLANTEPWIARPAPLSDPRLRLFCFPHAGSGAAQFWPWVDLLAADVELCPVRLPGRESRLREKLPTDLRETVRAIRAAMAPLVDRPFALFGHSMGALLGFELARQLADSKAPGPAHLFVSGRAAPHLPCRELAIHALPDTQFLCELERRYGPASIALLDDPELRELFLPVLRADFVAVESYTYMAGAQLRCPITAFGGLDDPRADEHDLLGWRMLTSSTFALHRFPGDHFFHHRSRQQLMAQVNAALCS